MTPLEILAVRTSFSRLYEKKDVASAAFYTHLFELDPRIKPMFINSDMEVQRDKLMVTLRAVVNGLDDVDLILPQVKALAIRHVEYGVQPEHYKLVGDALLFAIDHTLGREVSDHTRAAWVKAYEFLADFMIKSAYPTRH